jgi:hypothetical protein
MREVLATGAPPLLLRADVGMYGELIFLVSAVRNSILEIDVDTALLFLNRTKRSMYPQNYDLSKRDKKHGAHSLQERWWSDVTMVDHDVMLQLDAVAMR